MRILSVHLTDLCNSKCSFCVVGSPLYVADTIAYADVKSFLTSNAHTGFDAVNLHGGEATIHPNFIDTLRLIQRLGYPEVQLQTNGIRLADTGFAELISSLGVKLLIISLHGDTPQLHDAQTATTGGFVRTLEGIRNVKRLGLRVRTNTVITTQNVPRLGHLAQLAIDLGVDHLNFSNIHPVGSAQFGFVRIVPTFEEVRKFLYPALDLALSAGRSVTLEGFPYCTVPEYINLHINEQTREVRMLMRGRIIEDYDRFMNQTCRIYGQPCADCCVRERCGGVYPEYVQQRGWNDFSTISSAAA